MFTWFSLFFMSLVCCLSMSCDSNTSTLQPSVTSPSTYTRSDLPEEASSPQLKSNLTYTAYTYQKPDGNRLVDGKGIIPEIEPIEIQLDDEPRWLLAVPSGKGSLWAAVLRNGYVQAFHVMGNTVTEMPITPSNTSIDAPPVLCTTSHQYQLIVSPSKQASDLAPPAILSQDGYRLAFIESSGDLVIWEDREIARVSLNALPDTRLLTDEDERVLILTDPSGRYNHGILGDELEPVSITLVETLPTTRVVQVIDVPSPKVIEGLAPIWADLNGDGTREIIVTVSDAQEGAQIMVYGEDGSEMAVGPALGRGYRWRHQLVVAPFGPAGELELADVLTPHIGGIVEFYRMSGNTLEIVAQVPGYSSHLIGSRNLDMAVAGDFDSDGNVELLLPNQAYNSLGAIQRTADGAEVAWTVSVDHRITTNLAAVTFEDDTLALGVGHDGNMLRLWISDQRSDE